MGFRRSCVFLFCFFGLAYFVKTSADSKNDWVISQSGVECRLPLINPWSRMPALFGFGAALYQENKNDDRVTFSLVVTPFAGDQLTHDNLNTEIAEFHKAKKQFIEELGGEFIKAADSLTGDGHGKLYRASVNYRHDDTEYRDSTYFRFVAGRLVHAKVMYPAQAFEENKVEQQTIDLLAGMTCQTPNK
jgi:hypothetical protein